MKRLIVCITVFIILTITIIICAKHDCIVATAVAAIIEAIMGSLTSIVLENMFSNGFNLKLWWQHYKYFNKDVRLSFSYLFRIRINGKYLLVKGNRLKKQFQPVGGVYKFYDEAKSVLDGFNYVPDIKMGNDKETDDLRIVIKGKYLLKFMDWFLKMENREFDPYREFKEELIDSGLLPKENFDTIKYRKVGVHNKGVQYSTFLQCDELVYADIFELKLTDEQIELIKSAVENNGDMLCLAEREELQKQCYNGIEKNIGNNAVWLIGE